MSERKLLNRVKKLKELEIQKKAIEDQMEALKAEIQADMEAKGLEEQAAGDWIVRWTKVVTKRFDSKAFKKEHESLYDQYMKQTESRRFSIA